jgi:hypothetical protein
MKTIQFKGQDIKIGKPFFGTQLIYEQIVNAYKEENKVEPYQSLSNLFWLIAVIKSYNPDVNVTLSDFLFNPEIDKFFEQLNDPDILDFKADEGKN